MNTKTEKVQNLVAKHAHKFNRSTTQPDRKKEAKKSDYWRGYKKSSLWDLI